MMRYQPKYQRMLKCLFGMALASSLFVSLSVKAAPLDLATIPLANSPTITIQPNLLFILDDSGSMAQDYTPDYMSDMFGNPGTNERQCRDSGDDGTANESGTVGEVFPGVATGTTRVLDMCVVGDVPYMNNDMNNQYYNPAIRYRPAMNGDGTSMPSQTDPTSVLTDPFNIQRRDQLNPYGQTGTNRTTVNLLTDYPDRVWCTTQSPTAAQMTDPAVCRRNTDYLYPDATFKYGRSSGYPDKRVTTAMLNGVLKVYGAPYYYSVVPNEYCKAVDLKECTVSSVPVGDYIYPAKSRWCNSTELTDCQANRSGAYVWPRYIGAGGAGTKATGSFNVTGANRNQDATISSIKVNGVEIMGGSGTGCGPAISRSSAGNANNRYTALASAIASKINSCQSSPDYIATSSGQKVTITAALAGSSANGTLTFSGFANGASVGSVTGMSGGASSASVPPYNFVRTDITSSNNSYPKAAGRTDCAGATCTYAEEITNFANWYAYYRTRMQGIKTAASLAFKDIGEDFRIGFMTINTSSGRSLKFDTFNTAHKINWYNKFFSIPPSGSTPLRTALSRAGRIYANKETVNGTFTDPVQYSCQQNFALLTSDGYWNDSDSGVINLTGGAIGNMDGGTTPRPMYEGPTAKSNTLADVAKYYRDTDLRTTELGNCTGGLGFGVCQDPPPSTANQKQTMMTMTLGLGVDGELAYTRDYKTATFGDYFDIKNPNSGRNWPVPSSGTESAVDDMWHAAVNGEGTYFSAKSPDDLAKSLADALASIDVKVGAGAAAATSTLNPVAGDNFAYVASYTSGLWIGNLEKRGINENTGEVGLTALACVEDVVPSAGCSSPSSIQADGNGGYNCVTPDVSDPLACSGVLDGTNCKVPVAASCNGTLKGRVDNFTDSRKIFMKVGSAPGSLGNFNYANLTAAQKATFESDFLELNLSQWTSLTPEQQALLTGDNLVNYLRGQKGYEENSPDSEKRILRFRHAVLGDLIDSKPAFVGKPTFNYVDYGYDSFKSGKASRSGVVYAASNDGMLHAFDATTMEEKWAYVPSMVIPNMWKLADTAYGNKHSYYVNGDITISDICVSGCGAAGATWKTILVGGLNGGGRGYYALDITDPALDPTLLWEFDAGVEPNLGFTFGNPVVTKTPDGKWVVLVTSGYNNIPDNSAFYDTSDFKPNNPALFNTGDGKGYLFILNAVTGAKIAEISTGEGSTSDPSGLAKISAYAAEAERNNTATYVYGGDLQGNLWRFDLSDNSVKLFAKLMAGAKPQPITVKPELGSIKNHRAVFVGTGKYLERGDLTNDDLQTLYGIKDANSGATLDNPRGSLVGQTIVSAGAGNRKSGSDNAVNWDTGNGWYVDLPDSGERQNVASQLVVGTLLVPTTVPTSSACQPAGYGWFNYFDYRTGRAVPDAAGMVSKQTNSPIVGFNVVYIDGVPKVSIVTADNPTPQLVPGVPFSGSGSGFTRTRSIWRELITD